MLKISAILLPQNNSQARPRRHFGTVTHASEVAKWQKPTYATKLHA